MTPLFQTFIKYFVDAILIGVVIYVVYMTYRIIKNVIQGKKLKFKLGELEQVKKDLIEETDTHTPSKKPEVKEEGSLIAEKKEVNGGVSYIK